MDKIQHWIDGRVVESSGKTLPVYNPALGEVCAEVVVADEAIIQQAIASSQKAFQTWSKTTPAQRAALISTFKMLLDDSVSELAEIVTREHGKTFIESKGSVQRGIDVVNQVCGLPQLLVGRYFANVSTEIDSYSMRQPLGVCLGITPFNFPAMIPLWMFPMAIACGNTFILKPSEKNPSCAMKLAALAKKAGIPDGVVNVVHGDKNTVDAMLKHPGIAAVSFVGSSAVAEYVHQTASLHHKRVQAFGGAKNHAIIMPDADMNSAADLIVQAAYGSVGERCMAISVAVAVGDQTADALIQAMKPKIETIKVGVGMNADTTLGPLITKEHHARVSAYIQSGKSEGAVLVIDLEKNVPADLAKGYFMGPCLFDHVKRDMKIYQDEIFGPVLCVMRVKTKKEAIKLINENPYGNGTAIFTRDGYTARWFAENVEAGMVGINVPVPVPVPQQSFGGWKRSVFADTSMFGPDAIHFYTKLKTVTERWIKTEVSA